MHTALHSAFSARLTPPRTSPVTCVYCAAAVTIFGTTDVYELGFSYLSISIFKILCFHFNELSLTNFSLKIQVCVRQEKNYQISDKNFILQNAHKFDSNLKFLVR